MGVLLTIFIVFCINKNIINLFSRSSCLHNIPTQTVWKVCTVGTGERFTNHRSTSRKRVGKTREVVYSIHGYTTNIQLAMLDHVTLLVAGSCDP